MTTLVPFLTFCQALGVFIGAFTALWSEFAYVRAMRDGKIDAAERAHLRIIGRGLRFGMSLLLLASLGLVIVAYVLHTTQQPALTADYWTVTVLTLVIISISWALSRRHISFAFGSAILFTAWWFLAYSTLGWILPLSFGASILFFIVATAIFYGILEYARFLALHKI